MRRILILAMVASACTGGSSTSTDTPAPAFDKPVLVRESMLGAWKLDLQGDDAIRAQVVRAALANAPLPADAADHPELLALHRWIGALPADNPARSELNAWLDDTAAVRMVIRKDSITVIRANGGELSKWTAEPPAAPDHLVIHVMSARGDKRTWEVAMFRNDELDITPDARPELTTHWTRVRELPN